MAFGSVSDALKDFEYCARERCLSELPHAVAVRVAQRLGKLDGYRAGWKHYGRGGE